MAKTFGNIIEEVLSNVRGFTAASDQVTALRTAMSASATSGQVDNLSMLSTGTIEIGDELMWVTSVDSPSGSFQLLPQGRGWSGTTAVAHSIGDTVTVAPAYPRTRIKSAINDAVSALWPSLFAVATTEFVLTDPTKAGYEIPADAEVILDVRVKDFLGNWQRVRAWEVERSANTTDFPSGIMLRLPSINRVGQTVRVVYGKRPVEMVSESDLFSSTGLDDSTADLVILAVMANVLPMLDVARLQVTHVSADELDQPRPLGSAISIARDFRQQYAIRLQQERTALNQRYPARIHLTR